MALTTVKSDQIQSSVALAGSPTTTTQSASDNSTKVATTAYVETAVANLVASAPSALNTLDELAAALNDDASFSTTVTNSIATKLPLAGGSLTGAVTSSANISTTGSATKFISNSSSSGDYIRIYAGSGTGKWDIYGNGANLRFSDNDGAGGVYFDREIGIRNAPDSNYALKLLQNQSLTHGGYFQINGGTATGLEINATSGSFSGTALYVRESSVTTGGYLARFANSSGDKVTIATSGSLVATNVIQSTSNSGANAAFQTPWQNDTIALQMKYDANYLMNIEFDAATRDLIINNSTNDSTANIVFKTGGGGSSTLADRMNIDHDGHVNFSGPSNQDVGGTGPGTVIRNHGQLRVGTNDGTSFYTKYPVYLDRMNTAGNGPHIVFARHGQYKGGIGAIQEGGGNSSSAEGSLVLYTGTWSSAENIRLYIKAGGNIGIGENNPVAKLAIKGANNTNFEVQPDISSGINRITNFNRVNSTYKKLRVDASEHQTYISGNPKTVTSTHGLAFNTSSPTANNSIHAYQDATSWTPRLFKGTTEVTSATSALGFYMQIGDLVWVSFYFYKSSGAPGSVSGNWRIYGLPFNITPTTNAAYQSIPAGYVTMNSTNIFNLTPHRWQGNSTTYFEMYGNNGTTNWSSGAIEMAGTGVINTYP